MRFFKNLVSEGTKESHKRWISVTVAATICYGVIYVIHHYKDLISETLNSAMIFVAVMSGVTTVAQIAALIKGVPSKEPEPDKTVQTVEQTTTIKTDSQITKTE